MRRKIKYKVIGETAITLKEKVNLLKEQKTKILIDIEKIGEAYRGKDSNLIISKYKNKINELNIYIGVMEAYVSYFEWLSGNYQDSHNKATKNLDIMKSPNLDNNYNISQMINITGSKLQVGDSNV